LKKSVKKSGGVKKSPRGTKATSMVPLELLASAIHAQGDGVVVSEMQTDPLNLKIIFANDTFLRMTMRTSRRQG
jgi:hypothetical protein